MTKRSFDGLTSDLSLGDHLYENTLEEDVKINDDCLDEEFLNQPERFAWWATFENLKRGEAAELKNDLGELDARLGFAERGNLNNLKVKYTERMIAEHVITHPEHTKTQQQLMDAQKQLGQATAGRQAMEQRKEMLISLGANYRAEGAADPVILREEARRKSVEKGRLREAKRVKEKSKEDVDEIVDRSTKRQRKPPVKRTPR